MQHKLALTYCPTISLEELAKAYTILAMDHFDGNKSMTADALGISLKTLYNRFEAYEIDCLGNNWKKGQADPSIVQTAFPNGPQFTSADQRMPGVL